MQAIETVSSNFIEYINTIWLKETCETNNKKGPSITKNMLNHIMIYIQYILDVKY